MRCLFRRPWVRGYTMTCAGHVIVSCVGVSWFLSGSCSAPPYWECYRRRCVHLPTQVGGVGWRFLPYCCPGTMHVWFSQARKKNCPPNRALTLQQCVCKSLKRYHCFWHVSLREASLPCSYWLEVTWIIGTKSLVELVVPPYCTLIHLDIEHLNFLLEWWLL